jgi:glycosyltransferase involved in cell wall biosynthesis
VFYTGSKVGVDVYTENLIRELAATWRLTVYTSEPMAFEPMGVETRQIPGWSRGYRGRFLWVNTILPHLLVRDRVDVVLSPFVESPVSKIPSIAVVHDLTPLILPGSCPPAYTALFRISLKRLNRASAIVADSECTRRDIEQSRLLGDRPVVVIPSGTNIADFRPAEPQMQAAAPPEGPFLLSVGGFLPHKNMPLLLAAFAELEARVPHRLVLVGAHNELTLPPLLRRIEELELQSRVTVLTDVTTERLSSLYRRCELFVFPSRYEGFGLPVLEAMACGAPVLCSNSSSLPEVGGDAVRYFTPDSRTELVAGIMELLADASARARLSALGRARAQDFSWRRTAAGYSALIRGFLQKGSP